MGLAAPCPISTHFYCNRLKSQHCQKRWWLNSPGPGDVTIIQNPDRKYGVTRYFTLQCIPWWIRRPWYSGQVTEWRQCPGNQRTAIRSTFERLYQNMNEAFGLGDISWAKHFCIIIFRLRDMEIWQQPEKVYVYIAEGTGVSITFARVFYSGRKCQIATSGRQYRNCEENCLVACVVKEYPSRLESSTIPSELAIWKPIRKIVTTGAYQSLPRCIWRRIWHKVNLNGM